MPIGVNGGSLIVKDGKLADGCACCGVWYCQRTCDDFIWCESSYAEVSVSAQDYKLRRVVLYETSTTADFYTWERSVLVYQGSLLNGTHRLNRESDTLFRTASPVPKFGHILLERGSSGGRDATWRLALPVGMAERQGCARFRCISSEDCFRNGNPDRFFTPIFPLPEPEPSDFTGSSVSMFLSGNCAEFWDSFANPQPNRTFPVTTDVSSSPICPGVDGAPSPGSIFLPPVVTTSGSPIVALSSIKFFDASGTVLVSL